MVLQLTWYTNVPVAVGAARAQLFAAPELVTKPLLFMSAIVQCMLASAGVDVQVIGAPIAAPIAAEIWDWLRVTTSPPPTQLGDTVPTTVTELLFKSWWTELTPVMVHCVPWMVTLVAAIAGACISPRDALNALKPQKYTFFT